MTHKEREILDLKWEQENYQYLVSLLGKERVDEILSNIDPLDHLREEIEIISYNEDFE